MILNGEEAANQPGPSALWVHRLQAQPDTPTMKSVVGAPAFTLRPSGHSGTEHPGWGPPELSTAVSSLFTLTVKPPQIQPS